MSGRYYDELLKQIISDAKAKQEEAKFTSCEKTEHMPEIKEIAFVNPLQVSTKPILETEEDVDSYINKLSEELKAKIRANKRIKLQ